MVTIATKKHVKYDALGNDVIIAHILVASESELPTKTGITGKILHEGSTAEDLSTGYKYGMTNDGVWHKQPASFNLNFA